MIVLVYFFFFFSSRRRHTRYWRDWSSDVCSSDLGMERCIGLTGEVAQLEERHREGIAQREKSGGRSGGGEPERAGLDRESVVEGKGGELGGRRIIKKKKTQTNM